jgi:hypothetical protein
LLEYLDAVMAGRSAEAEDARLAVLPRPLQALWLLSWLEFEVTQGSLLAYFFNSTGRHAALAVAALHDIGAGRMEQVLTEAAAVVAADPAAWDKGRSDLDALGEWTVTQPYRDLPQADLLGGSMTSRFGEAAEIDDWGQRLDPTCVGRLARSPLGASSATDPGWADHRSWPGSTRTPRTRRDPCPPIPVPADASRRRHDGHDQRRQRRGSSRGGYNASQVVGCPVAAPICTAISARRLVSALHLPLVENRLNVRADEVLVGFQGHGAPLQAASTTARRHGAGGEPLSCYPGALPG